jgi:hypothetical protein
MSQAETLRRRFAKWRIDLAVHDALAIARKRSLLPSFERLLAVVVSRSHLLRLPHASGRPGWPQVELFLSAMLALCKYERNWLRDAEDWSTAHESLYEQFGSLARHLLATHAVPAFMTRVWFEEPSQAAIRHQKWFKHLALGNNIRGADLPLRLTKELAHFFPQAPDHLTVEQALRWSQVRGLGGTDEFAAAVVSSHLGTTFEPGADWTEILQFLIARRRLDVSLVAWILDDWSVRRFHRTPASLTRMSNQAFNALLERAHKSRRYALETSERNVRWPRSRIAGFRQVDLPRHQWSIRTWTIEELTDSQSLIDEGKAMRHCVARYAWRCARRYSSIWSLRHHGSLNSGRELTIEVDLDDREVVASLGKCNSRPKPDAFRVMEEWARRAGLRIAEGVKG